MKFQTVSLEVINRAEPQIDYEAMAKDAYISVTEKIGRQPAAITVGDRIGKGGHIYKPPFGSYGDYSCIVGSSKSRKTFLKSGIAAVYLGGRANFYFPNMEAHDTQGKYVIDIDTEQSKYHSQFVFKRTIEMVGSNSPYYVTYALRKYSPEQRLAFIDWLFTKSQYRGKIGLVLIDGYADLVSDFNSLEQSNNLQQKLLTWTEESQCHITGILHKNFNSEKPVGHVGSAVLKKAETVVFTELDKDLTRVKCEYSRNLGFENFDFRIDADWLPRVVGSFLPEPEETDHFI